MKRWKDAPKKPAEPDLDDRLGALLRDVADPGPLSPAHLARVEARVVASLDERRLGRRGLRRPRFAWVVGVAVLLFGGGGAVFARREIAHFLTVIARHLDVPDEPLSGAERRALQRPAPRARATPRLDRPPLAAAAPAAPAAVGSLPAEEEAPSRRAPMPREARVSVPPSRSAEPPASRPGPTTAPPPLALPEPRGSAAAELGPLAREATSVRLALEELRRWHAPAEALRLLDEHDAAFPAGSFRADAAAVRVRALLELGRDVDALRLLEGDALRAGPRRDELDVLRGELLAVRDCRAAAVVLDGLVARRLPADLAERVRRARAACGSLQRRGQTP